MESSLYQNIKQSELTMQKIVLVQEILNEEPKKLKNEKSINRDTFTQTLKIKM